jgi:hypothetical protein
MGGICKRDRTERGLFTWTMDERVEEIEEERDGQEPEC